MRSARDSSAPAIQRNWRSQSRKRALSQESSLAYNSINIAPVLTRGQDGPGKHAIIGTRECALLQSAIRTTIATSTDRPTDSARGFSVPTKQQRACTWAGNYSSSRYLAFLTGNSRNPVTCVGMEFSLAPALIHCVKLPALGRNGT